RLLVARLVLEADVDVVAALDHLLGRLGEARLVAVDGWDREEPGQEREQADEHEPPGRAPVRARGLVCEPLEAPPQRQQPFRCLVGDDGHASPSGAPRAPAGQTGTASPGKMRIWTQPTQLD